MEKINNTRQIGINKDDDNIKVLITGGCGFVGHHIVQHIIINTSWNIIILDKLSYSSKGLERLRDMNYDKHKRIKIYSWDLINSISEGLSLEIGIIDVIIHLAAESHVDNSIEDPKFCIKNNVMSTVNILEFARSSLQNIKLFLYCSTDEVFGPREGDTLFKEWDRHKPGNPYSASKSASESICLSYENTYNIPLIIINMMNIIGERQLVEKFVPLAMKKILNNEIIYIHGDKHGNPGSRMYIHARNIADCILFLLKNGESGEKYNVPGEKEIDNLELAKMIADTMKMELKYEIVDFHSKRPGHDLKYGLDGTKLYSMGWKPPISLNDTLRKIIMWTLEKDNIKWLDN